MSGHKFGGLKRLTRIALAGYFGLVALSTANADFIEPIDEIAEMLIQAQQSDAAAIGTAFGPDAATTLVFSTNIDLAGKAFTYSLASGSTYLGSSATLDGSGSFDSISGSWNWPSHGSFSGNSFDSTGSMTITGDPVGDGPVNFDVGPIGPFSLHYHEVYTEGPLTTGSLGDGSLTIFGLPVVTFHTVDRFNINTGKMEYTQFSVGFAVDGVGVTPTHGGDGTFTMHIRPVPEPSTFALLGMSGLGIAGYGWRRRRITSSCNQSV